MKNKVEKTKSIPKKSLSKKHTSLAERIKNYKNNNFSNEWITGTVGKEE